MSIYIEDKNGKRRKFAGVGSEKDYIDDGIASEKMTWSSEKILDTLCPPFTETGNPVTCNPVEGYPLSAVVTLKPKQAGSDDPSPENVRAITGYDSAQVTRCGKNLITLEHTMYGAYGYTVGTTSITDYKIFLVNGATYTLSFNAEFTLGTYLYCRSASITSPQQLGKRSTPGSTTFTFTFDKPTDFYIIYLYNGSIWEDQPFTKWQLEVGSTPSPYEPYKPGTSTEIALPETIYGGTVDAVKGVGEKTWEFVKFNGTENIIKRSTDFNSYQITLGTTSVEGICSHFKRINFTELGEGVQGAYLVNSSSCIFNYDVDTVEEFKDYLRTQSQAETPVQICYQLATPEPFQAGGNRPLSALPGTNTLYTDGNSLTVSGSTSPISAIESFKADVQASANQAEAVANILLGGA